MRIRDGPSLSSRPIGQTLAQESAPSEMQEETISSSYPELGHVSPAFAQSARSISRSVGFSPEASSDSSDWNQLALYAWRGQCQRAEFEPFPEPVVIYHLGGAQDVAVRTGRDWRQRTHPGRITIIPPNTSVAWDIRGEVHSRSIHLRSRLLNRTAEDCGTPVPELRFRCGIEDPLITVLVESLEKHLRSPSENGTLYADEMADTLALHLMRMYGRGAPRLNDSGGLSRSVLDRCIDRLHASVIDGISLQHLADEARLSRTYFADAFRKATGKAPHQYLSQIRLEYARGLLTHSGISIADIAFRCGFSSQAHLTTAFRKAFGKPPRRYRLEA